MSSIESRESRSPSRGVLIAAGAIIALLSLNWVAAVARFQVEGIYWDQWMFLEPMFKGEGWLALFTQQHGPHRQGIAFIITSWIMEWSGWDTRVEALWGASLLMVAAVMALVWKYRLTGRLGWIDLWLPLAALGMRQYENIILVPNASHSMFPLVLMWSAALVILRELSVRRWLALGVIGVLALFTGFALFVWGALMGLVVLVSARELWRKQYQNLVGPGAGAAILLAGLGWFLHGYLFNPASPGATFPHYPLGDYPLFVVRMLASRMGMLGGGSEAMFWGWIVLGLAIAGWGIGCWRIVRSDQIAAPLLATVFFLTVGLGYAVFTALGRVHLGVEGGEASRYTPLMISFWVGVVAWTATAKWRGLHIGAAILGWAMVVVPWMDMWDRPWRDWPGTLGMSQRSRTAIVWTTSYKTKWLLAWQETGDWREAEKQVPNGVHPGSEGSPLGEQIEFLAERRLSFLGDPKTDYTWLPWWNPLGVRWVQGMGGEHEQWMAEEGRFLVDGADDAFVNLRLRWKTLELPEDAPIEIQLGEFRGQTTYAELVKGLSVPIPTDRQPLTLRSKVGVAPIHPPHDPRPASFLVLDPTVTTAPRYEVKWFSRNDEGLLPDEVDFRWADGFHDWNPAGGFVWTGDAATVEMRTRQTRYLNVVIEGRYEHADDGPIRLYVNDDEWLLDWVPGGMSLSIEIPGGQSSSVTLRNIVGSKSPRDFGESDDARFLALRITRISFDEQPAFPVLE